MNRGRAIAFMWATLSLMSLPHAGAWYLWVLNAAIGVTLLAEELGGFVQVLLLTLVMAFGVEAWHRYHHEPAPHVHVHKVKARVAARCSSLGHCDLIPIPEGGKV